MSDFLERKSGVSFCDHLAQTKRTFARISTMAKQTVIKKNTRPPVQVNNLRIIRR